MAQLQLLDLMIRTEKVAVPMDATVRANLIDLMASILRAVFHAEGGVDDRGLSGTATYGAALPKSNSAS